MSRVGDAAVHGVRGAGTPAPGGDPALLTQIREVLEAAPFVGEGHRKVWARLRYRGVRTSKARVLRLMRDAQLLAPTRLGHAHGPAAHDGTILTARPDVMWGTDATSCLTRREGTATIFIAIDHCTAECVGIHAANPGTRFEALEPIRQGGRAAFGGYAAGVAAGLQCFSAHEAAGSARRPSAVLTAIRGPAYTPPRSLPPRREPCSPIRPQP